MPAAHTDGDTIVQFRESEVLAVGDIINMNGYPVIDIDKGGTVQGVVNALNWILEMAVVEHMMEGGTIIVPGHGRLIDSADAAYYRDMVTIMRDRVRAAVKKGMTLPQIKAAKLTRLTAASGGRRYAGHMFIGRFSASRCQIVRGSLCADSPLPSRSPLSRSVFNCSAQGRGQAAGQPPPVARAAAPCDSPATGSPSSPTTGATGC
jgi:hypothetical protein